LPSGSYTCDQISIFLLPFLRFYGTRIGMDAEAREYPRWTGPSAPKV